MIYLIAAILFLFALIVFAAGCIKPEPPITPDDSHTEPNDSSDIDVTASVAVELGCMGFTVRFWPLGETYVMQITDSEAITFYMPKDASLKQCIDRYREKLDEFYGTQRFSKSVHA